MLAFCFGGNLHPWVSHYLSSVESWQDYMWGCDFCELTFSWKRATLPVRRGAFILRWGEALRTCRKSHEKWTVNMPKCGQSHAKWKVNMPKCGQSYAKWKVNMPKCGKSHAKWKVNMSKCGKYHTKWKVNTPTCRKSHAKWRWTCPNVANTMQNDKFKFQTVANTRQMVPAKKSKKKSQTCWKKNPKTISHPLSDIPRQTAWCEACSGWQIASRIWKERLQMQTLKSWESSFRNETSQSRLA